MSAAADRFLVDYGSEMICPFCGAKQSDAWEITGDETSCSSCEKTFGIERDHDVSYRTFVPEKKETHKERTDRERRALKPENRSFETEAPKPIPRTGEIGLYETTLHLWDEHCEDKPMAAVLHGVLAVLHQRGFHLERDPETVENYPTLADDNWYGERAGLEVAIRLGGRHIEMKFYQSINVEHPSGGYYDRNQEKRMSRSMLLACIADMKVLIERYFEHGYVLSNKRGLRRELPLALRVRDAVFGWQTSDPRDYFLEHGWRNDERAEPGFLPKEKYKSWRYHDRDGVELHAGATRYFYEQGRIMRGTVYPDHNGRWLVVVSGRITHCETEKFFLGAEREPRRYVPKQKERLDRELEKALKQRDYTRVRVLAGVIERGAFRD